MRTGLYAAGAVFWLAAAYFLYSGFALHTSVPADSSLTAGEVANLQLMHVQTMDFLTGCASAIVAAVLTGCAAIIEALGGQRA